MLRTIDLNCDVGETNREQDHQILPLISSCNVSCGAHAGNPVLIASTIREALRLGVCVGAHPSYPDRANFGRQPMEIPLEELREHLRYQISAIQGVVHSLGGELNHVKPHGALYSDMTTQPELATMVIELVHQLAPSVAFYGFADSHLLRICDQYQLQFVHEVFADRRYEEKAKLRSRDYADSLLDNTEDFCRQFTGFLNGSVVDVKKQKHAITVQTICLHSDTPNALEYAQFANQILKENHVRMAAP